MIGLGGSFAVFAAGIIGSIMLLAPVDWLIELDRVGNAGGGYYFVRRAETPEQGRFRAMLYYRILGSILVGIAVLVFWPG